MISENYNLAVNNAKGDFFVPSGHDDEFIPETLQTFLDYWDRYGSKDFSGISCLCIDQQGNQIGDKFPDSPFFSNYVDIVYNRKIKGEKWGFIRTDVMKEFPMHPQGVYVTEGLTWLEMGKKYNTIFINEPLRIYFINQSHSSLSSTSDKKIKYPEGCRFYFLEMLNNQIKDIDDNYLLKVKIIFNYVRYGFHCKRKWMSIVNEVKNFKHRCLVFFALFFGWSLYINDKIRNRI